MATAKKTPVKSIRRTAKKAAATGSASVKRDAKTAKEVTALSSSLPSSLSSLSSSRSSSLSSSSSSDKIDQQLAHYQSIRDFSITAEPSGEPEVKGKASTSTPKDKLPFVIQKHAASHLHYDFRLGWNGVLKSWACAKGPSYYPGDKRLAVQVEDHPMAYGGFEGIIPAGQYGGGTVMLWDQGTWEPQPGHTDVNAGLRDGSLKFTMFGTKMKGNWVLVRMGGKAANEKKPNWLLIKEHDSFEKKEGDVPVTEAFPNSVVTKRSLQQIAASEDHVWNSKDTANPKRSAWFRQEPESSDVRKKKAKKSGVTAAAPFRPRLADAAKESLPTFIAPQLATQAETPPNGTGWIHELKLDGYRIQARLHQGKVELLTRTGLDWTQRMKSIAADVATLPADAALLDGEVVVLAPDGTTSFADLQAAFMDGKRQELTYFVFDLLHLNGHSLRGLPLIERKALLTSLLQGATGATGATGAMGAIGAIGAIRSTGSIRLSEHLDMDATTVFHKACQLHAEGILSKRSDAMYISGRSSSWLKLKCIHEQEFVIGGFTLPGKGHAGLHGIGSLLLGYYDEKKQLIYAGRTGTGFSQKTHGQIRTRLESLRRVTAPFHEPPAEARRGAIWVTPALVAQVRFATWTADNLLRQAAFQGLREDKPAREVRKEEPTMKPRTARAKPSAKRASHAAPVPVAAKTAPTISKTVPAAVQTSPATVKTVPPTVKTSPATVKTSPAAVKTVPAAIKQAAVATKQAAVATRQAPAAAKQAPAAAKQAPAAAKQEAVAPSSGHAPIRLTHPDKVLDPESKLTKQQLADYYWSIAQYMLPQIAGRPLSLVRCPEGSTKPCFFQKHTSTMLPAGIETVQVPDKKTGKLEPYITLSTAEALSSLAQMGVLELHPWGSRNDDLEHPDRIIIDLDPDAAISWATLAGAAAEVRKEFKKLGLESFLKSTGGKGLHVVVPIQPQHDWATIKQFAHAFVLSLEKSKPALYLTKMSKSARTGKIYLDYLRNERGATAVAAFSPRARAGAPVSLPLHWNDLKLDERPVFHVADFDAWKGRLKRDPWRKLTSMQQQLPTGL